jgi:hypothetical protein
VRAVVAAVALVLQAGCSSGDPFAELPTPDSVDLPPTTSTSEVDLTGVPLNPVEGSTTTTVALGPGPLTIVGHVEGPDGPLAGAVVQLERLVDGGTAGTRVPTAPDGTWNLSGVLGGRYRIRAWRAPDLASHSQVVFLQDKGQQAVDIRVDPVGGVRVDAAVAPDPPIVDEPVNLKVRVAERSVNAEGVLTDVPVSGVSVDLGGTGDWDLDSPNPSTTGGDGSTVFRMTCQSDGAQPLFATVAGGESYARAIPPCVDPDATTTTTSATTTWTSA